VVEGSKEVLPHGVADVLTEAVALEHKVRVGVGEGDAAVEGLPEALPLTLWVRAALGVAAPVPLGCSVRVADAEPEGEGGELGVISQLPLLLVVEEATPESEAAVETETLAVPDAEALAQALPVAEAKGDPDELAPDVLDKEARGEGDTEVQAEEDTEGCVLGDALGLGCRESEGAPDSEACALADALGERDSSAEGLREADGHSETVEVVEAPAEVDAHSVADTGALPEATSEGEGESVGPCVGVTLCGADGEGLREAEGDSEAVEVVEAQLLSLAAPRLGVGRAPLALAAALGVRAIDSEAHAVKEGGGLGEAEGTADVDTEGESDKLAAAEAELEAPPVREAEADVLGVGVGKVEAEGEEAELGDWVSLGEVLVEALA